ncbi:uncharacterized protein LOC134265418 [Saccostrea cucullata]|uniref:uncharacterized protein LOC134265418 n=1 Tax=Saccostrea cuccullata TaxID=36930 RepID=UPI002ED41B1B
MLLFYLTGMDLLQLSRAPGFKVQQEESCPDLAEGLSHMMDNCTKLKSCIYQTPKNSMRTMIQNRHRRIEQRQLMRKRREGKLPGDAGGKVATWTSGTILVLTHKMTQMKIYQIPLYNSF